MCFGANKAAKDAQAKQQQAADEQNALLEKQRQEAAAQLAQSQAVEAARQGKIATNSASIDDAFSQFNDDYYKKAADNVTNYYTPQLDQQFTDAQRKTALDLAEHGQSDSSIAARKAGELKTMYDTQLQQIQSKSQDAANQAKTDVSTQKGNLKSLAESGQSLDNFKDVITPSIQSIALPSSYDTLGQVFSSITNDTNSLQKNGLVPTFNNNNVNNTNAASTNSSRIIA